MTVSVCMIVKNEEKLLRRCLDSLEGIYDELVIVDTGSTDRTKEIAWEYTDEVYDFEWVNDFAAARNFAFSKCTKDYIYSADADEVLEDKQREMLKVLMQYLDPKYEIVNMLYLTPIDFNEANGFEREYRQKMFKRLRSWTWIDPVHESMRLEPLIFDSDIVVRHLPAVSHEGRDCAIFEKAVSRGETLSPKMHGLYARELYLNGNKEDLIRAKEYFEGNVENFWKRLPELDAEFEVKRKKLEAEKKRWRFVATFEGGKTSVGLQEIDMRHPFYDLEGSNNIVMLTTERYKEFPMLIQGYGAGASVTAAGVFANIMSIANI